MSRRTTYGQALNAINAIRAAIGGTGHDLSRVPENLNVLESYIGNGDKPDKPVFKIDVSATGARAGQLATDHWSYIEGVLQAHGIDKAEILAAKFHYIAAMIHGYKHGIEDVNDGFKW